MESAAARRPVLPRRSRVVAGRGGRSLHIDVQPEANEPAEDGSGGVFEDTLTELKS